MSDHDRGAYAPQHDGPALSFDARRDRSRSPAPFTLIFSAVVLAALVGAIFLFYRGGVREAGGVPPTVGAPVTAMKGPAPAEAQPTEEAELLDVYVEGGETETTELAAAGAGPAFAAPPEQPRPRPTLPPPAPVVAAAPAPRPATTPATRAAATTRPVQTASVRSPVATPPTRPTQVAAASPTPAPATVARVTVAPPAPALRPATPPPAQAVGPSGGGFGVQIGAFSSQAMADSEFAKVAGGFGVSGKGKSVTQVPKDGQTLYRTVVTGFDRQSATTLCNQMKAAGRQCFVKPS